MFVSAIQSVSSYCLLLTLDTSWSSSNYDENNRSIGSDWNPSMSPNLPGQRWTSWYFPQGGSVAEKFLSIGWNVRGITRNSASNAARSLASKGIEVVSADIDKPTSLIPAFSGVEVIFAVTDFWAPFFASYGELSKTSDRATGEHALSIELKRGKAIVDAAAKVLDKEGKLERFIWSSLPSVNGLSNGKYTYDYHHDSKAQVAKYLQEREGLWERSSILLLGFYTTNVKTYKDLMGFTKQVRLCRRLYGFRFTDWQRKTNQTNTFTAMLAPR